MEILGWVFVGIIGIIVLLAAILGVMGIPDAKRYLKLRRM